MVRCHTPGHVAVMIVERLGGTEVVVFATHFAPPTAGRLQTVGGVVRFVALHS